MFSPLAFRLRVPLASLGLGPALPLPLRPLPTSHLPQALWISAVPLVISLRLKPPAALLPQTASPPQPPPTGRDTLACRKMRTSHGRSDSLGAARGGVASSSGTPLFAHDSARHCRTATVAHVYGPLCRRAPIHGVTGPPLITRMSDGGEENKEGDGSDMRGLEGDGGRRPTSRRKGSKQTREEDSPKKDGYDSRRAAGDERAESDGVFKAAAKEREDLRRE